MDKKTAVIIDDMELARANLNAELAEHFPDISVLGEADGVLTGIKLIKEHKPDIVFLDIEMEDGLGFDVLDILDDIHTRVIFVTGSQDYAIRAFRYAAMDYILKPIATEDLRQAIEKVVAQSSTKASQANILREQWEQPSKKLALHTTDRIQIVDYSDIVRLEAMGNYTHFFFADGNKLLVTRTLKEYDQLLSEEGFLRVHQSHLINLSFVEAYIKTEGGYILMKDGSHVSVSVRKKPKVVEILASL